MPEPIPAAPELRESQTGDNLRVAYARDAQATRLLATFARIAEIEGFPQAATALRELADLRAVEADGHLDLLTRAGDPLSGAPLGGTLENLEAALQAEREHTFQSMAKTAHAEGFPDAASWFETLVLARDHHAAALTAALAKLKEER